MRLLEIKIIAFVILVCTSAVNAAGLSSVCKGRFFNPISDPNWNYALPIVLFGKAWGGSNSDNPPEMLSPAFCNCPSLYLGGTEVPGIFMSYWRPYKVIDVSRVPACSISLGGKVLLDGYEHNFGASNNEQSYYSVTNRSVMEWDYDLLGILKIFEALGCQKVSSISLAYDTNIDPTMNTIPNGSTGESEAVTFFKSLPLLLGCAVDAVASTVWHPLTFLPQCHGAQTPAFGYQNWNNQTSGPRSTNYKAAVVHLQRQASRFMEWVTIGPTAICFSHPFYFLMKGGYRINPVYPIRQSRSYKNSIGASAMIADFYSPPMQPDSSYLIWKAHQCCLKPVP